MSARPEDIALLTAAIEERLGIALDPARAEAVLAKRGAGWVDRISADPAALRAVVPEITIGETYFFRHEEQLHAFRDVALVERCQRGVQNCRVLSAGCSSGEEPYTLAMFAREAAAEHGVPAAAVTIDAFDASEVALRKAQRARYTRWSLRSVPPDIERRYFHEEGAELVLAPFIRDAVSFTRASLLDPLALPHGHYDVIFCRNVLMYFTPAALAATLHRLSAALAPGGYLFLGHAEILRNPPPGLAVCESHGTFYYHRGEGRRIASVSETQRALTADTAWFTTIADSSERVKAMVQAAGSSPTVVPAASASSSIATAIEAARAAISREDFVAALSALTAIPTEHQQMPDVLLLRAIALTEHSDSARAIAACNALVASGAHAASGHYLRAVSHESEGDLTSALHHTTRATELDPQHAMAQLRRGLIARRIGDVTVARDALTRALHALGVEPRERLELFAGGLGRDTLIRLCQTELAALDNHGSTAPA